MTTSDVSAAGDTRRRERSRSDEEPHLDVVPPALTRWLHGLRRQWTLADTWAMIITFGQLPVLAWLLFPGSHYIDDFRGQSYAAGESWWPFVVQSNGTHLSVVARTLDLLQVRLAPLDHTVTVLITLGMRVVLGLVLWRVFRLLFGPRLHTLVPLCVLLAGAALVPVSAWYRQAMVLVPLLIAIALATDQHVRWMAAGRARNLTGAVLALTLGLLAFEKAVSMGPYLAALTVALFAGRGARFAWRRAVSALGAYALITTAYLAYYFNGQFDTGDGRAPTPWQLVQLTGRTLFESMIPALLGGPWRWSYETEYYGIADPPRALAVIAAIAVGAVLLLAALRRPGQVARGLVVASGYLLPLAYLVGVGRYFRAGMIISADYRFWVDAMLPLVLGLCIALLPVRAGVLAKQPDSRMAPRTNRLMRPALGAVAMLAAVGAAVSTLSFAEQWHRNPADDWVQHVIRNVGSRPVTLFSTAVPSYVVPYWVQPDYSLEDLLAPVAARGDVPVEFHVADRPAYVVDASGALRVPALTRLATNVTPPLRGCGFPVRPGQKAPTTIAFDAPAPYYRDSTLQLRLLVARRTSLHVSLLTEDGVIRLRNRSEPVLERAPHTVLYRIPNGTRVTGVQVRPDDSSAGLCVTSAQVVLPRVPES